MKEIGEFLWRIAFNSDWTKTFLKSFLVFTPFSAVLALFALIISNADVIHTKVVALQGLVATSGWAGMYGKINVLLPMTETLAIMAALLGLKVVCLLVRFVKVLIPNIFTGS